MLALTTPEGKWLKTLTDSQEPVDFVYHKEFGFIPADEIEERAIRRERYGLRSNREAIAWGLNLQCDATGKIKIGNLRSCQSKVDGTAIEIESPTGKFKIVPLSQAQITPVAEEETESTRLWKTTLLAFFFVAAVFTFMPKSEKEVAPEVILEPVKVTVIPEVKKQKAVTVPAVTSEIANKLKVQDQETKRAIQQNLGFLGLLGKKNLTKALGGMPSTIKDASPGAGAGGKEGSGGEYLVGLGQGVRRATVGNTGVAGLGGIGTKGAGGGAGGYGDSMVGSGEGKSLSKVALSNELTLEGGLDRAVIQATIAKYLSQVRACYEEQLQGNPGLSGQVTMAFTINGQGSVTESNVSRTTLGNSTVENCISARMKSWNFPKPVGGVSVKVNYPFLLRPAGA